MIEIELEKFDTLKKFHIGDNVYFEMNGNKVGVAQLTAVRFDLLNDRKAEFLDAMQALQKEQGYQSMVMMLTDIQSEGTELLVVGKNQLEIGKAFQVSLENHSAWIAGLMSRKKQIIPALEKVFDDHDK